VEGNSVSSQDEIRRTLAEFGRFLDERRFTEWSELFTDEATFGETAGRATILAKMLEGELATQPELFRKHATVNSTILVEGDHATAVSDLLLFERETDGAWLMRFGLYEDTLRQVGDRWLIQRRQLSWTANPIDDGNPVIGQG
jgi:ketosteroid isomerase-like protein